MNVMVMYASYTHHIYIYIDARSHLGLAELRDSSEEGLPAQ